MHLTPGTTEACPTPASVYQAQCQSFVKHRATAKSGTATPAVDPGLITPADLQAAYGLTGVSAANGTGLTVAVVDAFGDPQIAGDLAAYRTKYGLPACTVANGCLKVLNQNGATSPLPAANSTDDGIGWQFETSLDVDMVSAICPNCHIDVFEATNDLVTNLGTADNSAAKVTKFVSNSWSSTDFPGDSAWDTVYFNHPGVAMTFSSGDFGYGPSYPGASGLVTSVGGTYLQPSSTTTTGWTESAWSGQSTGAGTGTGSGCSAGEGKPSWQNDSGCKHRTQNDVSAVADAPGGIDVFSSSGDCNETGTVGSTPTECQAYGTSASAPIIAALYALAGTPDAGTYPSRYPWMNHTSADVNDVTTGNDGACESTRAYMCTAETGYDGPTGWGTPNGTGLFTPPAVSSTSHLVSVINPGLFTLEAGVKYSLPGFRVANSSSGQTYTFSATGLPAGFTINSKSGIISGTLSTATVNAAPKVTVKDATGASDTISFGITAVHNLIASYHPGVGFVQVDFPNKCVNDRKNLTTSGTPVEIYTCENVASESGWSYLPSPAPGLAGTMRIHGKCMYVTASKTVALTTCNGSASEGWYLEGFDGEIVSQLNGLCLNAAKNVTGTQLTTTACNETVNQAFLVPSSAMTSGVTGKCAMISGSSMEGYPCGASGGVFNAQRVTLGFDGTLRIGTHCMDELGANNGSVVAANGCPASGSLPAPQAEWFIVDNGEIENAVSSKCLTLPSATTGAKLTVQDCQGLNTQIWAVS